jgi:hypothetical protein
MQVYGAGMDGNELGYIWVIYPRDRSRAMIATGITDDEGEARANVEIHLTIRDDALLGIVIIPGTGGDVCCRSAGEGEGEYHWSPLLTEPA